MSEYEQLLREMFGPLAADVGMGRIPVPERSLLRPFLSEGFPPSLVPLGTYDITYVGFWVANFEDSTHSIVSFSLENCFPLEEAFTLQQYVFKTGLELLINKPARIAFAADVFRRFGIAEDYVSEYLKVDESRPFLFKHVYTAGVPLAAYDDPKEYIGRFPTEFNISASNVRSFSSFMMSPEALAAAVTLPNCPPWLTAASAERDQLPVFQSCIQQGDLRGAWCALNSTRWTDAELRAAMNQFASLSSDENVRRLNASWHSFTQRGQ